MMMMKLCRAVECIFFRFSAQGQVPECITFVKTFMLWLFLIASEIKLKLTHVVFCFFVNYWER